MCFNKVLVCRGGHAYAVRFLLFKLFFKLFIFFSFFPINVFYNFYMLSFYRLEKVTRFILVSSQKPAIFRSIVHSWKSTSTGIKRIKLFYK